MGSSADDRVANAPAALRTLSQAVVDDVDRLTDRLMIMVLRREPTYAQLAVSAPDELRKSLRSNMERGIQMIGGTVADGVDPRGTSFETGRRRARQGIALEAVLRAYRLGGRVIWEGLLATSRERFAGHFDDALLDGAGHVWRVIDAGSAAVADAYRVEESRLRNQELGKRQAYLNAVLEGRGNDPALAEEAASALGLPPRGPMVCIVAPVDSPLDEPLRSPRDVLAARGIVSSWQVRAGDIVGLVGLGDHCAAEALDAVRPAVAGRAGASPVVHTLAEVADAYLLAQTAARTLREPGLAALDDRLPEALLAGSPRLAHRLQEVAFGELLKLPETDRETLLKTLQALIDAGGSPTRAAQRLYCHRNTVIYRMQRIEVATGRKTTEPRDHLLFTLGLLARTTTAAQ